MKLPKQFFIKGSLWKVAYKWNLTFKNKRVEALMSPSDKIIYIDRSLSREDKFWAFKHEWRHAVWDAYECGFNHEQSKDPLTREELMNEALDVEERNTFNPRWKK
jgi:hypothetical protein